MMAAAASAERFARRNTSPFPDVTDDAWDRFVHVLNVQPIVAVSAAGGYGSYDLRPRRLAELGVMRNVRGVGAPGKRQAYVGDFVAPHTEAEFLRNPLLQYRVLVQSLRRYDDGLREGVFAQPEGMSRSGALLLLHCGGRGALAAWPSRLFEGTKALFDRANLIF